jgi:SAM-dependent methyltransferase
LRAEEYEKLDAVEDGHWWFYALRNNLVTVFKRQQAKAIGRILDAGCGTGATVLRLAQEYPNAVCIGLDLDQTACVIARRKSGSPVCAGSVNAIPFCDACFDTIFSSDVLCHAGVEAEASLEGFRKALKPGGLLLLNLPSYPWLMSEHDRAVSNARRFTRGEVKALLRRSGFADARITYWNMLLFPLMVFHRKFAKKGASSDVEKVAEPLNAVLKAIMVFENRLLQWGILLPFGGSLLAIARRP